MMNFSLATSNPLTQDAELGDVLDSIKSHGGMATHTAVIINDVFTNKPF